MTYRCSDCGDSFESRYELSLHFKKAHPVKPQVFNIRDFPGGRLPPHCTYCGRGSFAGNPYRIGIDGTREEVIARYRAERENDAEFIAAARRLLRGQNLVCHCKPLACHCDWLIEVVNDPGN